MIIICQNLQRHSKVLKGHDLLARGQGHIPEKDTLHPLPHLDRHQGQSRGHTADPRVGVINTGGMSENLHRFWKLTCK